MPSILERRAASLFSTAMFRPIMSGKPSDRIDATIRVLSNELGLSSSTRNHDVVDAAYEVLSERYRSEYFYKNLITSKIFVGRHRASNAVLLNEFRVGNAVADCVLINGTGVVYEIKTEFDSPDKLDRQLANYYQAFPLVNVVAHANTAERYLRALEGSSAGLLVVGARGRLSTAKEAESDESSLDTRTMFNALRLAEIELVLRERFGVLPNVPNGIRYSEYLALAKKLPVVEFQRTMQKALKLRAPRGDRALLVESELASLRSVVLQLDPDAVQGENLVNWLDSKES